MKQVRDMSVRRTGLMFALSRFVTWAETPIMFHSEDGMPQVPINSTPSGKQTDSYLLSHSLLSPSLPPSPLSLLLLLLLCFPRTQTLSHSPLIKFMLSSLI